MKRQLRIKAVILTPHFLRNQRTLKSHHWFGKEKHWSPPLGVLHKDFRKREMGYGNGGFSKQKKLFGQIRLFRRRNNTLGLTEPIMSVLP